MRSLTAVIPRTIANGIAVVTGSNELIWGMHCVHRSINQSINQSSNQSINQSIDWSYCSAFVDQSSWNLEPVWKTLCSFKCHSPIVCIMFHSKTFAVKVAVKLQGRRKASKIDGFRVLILTERGYPNLWIWIIKSHSVPNMWWVLAKFRSMSSESSWRKKICRRYNLGKIWGHADYVGRPNKDNKWQQAVKSNQIR